MTPLPNVDIIARVSQNMEEEQLTPEIEATRNSSQQNLSLSTNNINLAGLNLNLETDRLRTYDNWPNSFINKKDLAAAGFYYTNRGDIVKCPVCEVEVGCWAENDNPITDHEKHSPNCRYVIWRKLRSSQNTESSNNAPSDSSECESYFPAGEDTCGPNGVEGRRSPVLELERMSRDTMLKKLHVNASEEPVDKDHSSYLDRLRTYARWPKHSKLSPEALSDAGFVYSDEGDRTSCFHCGGTLHNWDDFDEPWIEHAHWFPNCKYVLIMKGQKFIDDARVKKHEDLARVQDEIKSAIETLKENVSTVGVNNVNSKDKVNESSSEGNRSSESSVSEDSAEPIMKYDRESRMSCLICLEQERDSILLPCYHMVACLKCATKLTKCCVCREPVIYRRRVYIP